ncbi:cation diffusion facilitator family transporter [Aquabacter spiritensis]|uniref:Cation diffusion facilitator family transporter n=2 Tax=Aquabacter spiritensis TaxID=933073 RepID=A0A4R3LJZ2_9HYPH|nr:cation diffusion facilitator family transporter [Aquabacter spiritensis]
MCFVAVLFPFYVLAASLTNSAAVLSDLLATSFDLTSLTACWLVLRIAHRAKGEKFAYGLGKLENLAELLIAVLQVVLVIIATARAVAGLLHPEPVSGAGLGLAVTAVAVAGNLYLHRRARQLALQSRSPVLAAQARVHFISALSSGAVFAVTVVTSNADAGWVVYLDPAASFLVIALMIYNVFQMMTNSLGSLLDQAIGEAGQLQILKALTLSFDEFEELGDIRTRQHGGRMIVELHLGFDPHWTVARARQAVATLTAAVKETFAETGDDVDVSVVLLPPTARTFAAALAETAQWSERITSSDQSPDTSLTTA